MPKSFYPRLSEAKDLFPLLRAHLVTAAAHHSLPVSLALNLLPIVEDGVFGYEILPNRETQTYLTIGRDDRGEPLLRKSIYCAEVPSSMRLATVNGRILLPGKRDSRRHMERHDATFPDWASATEAAWAELVGLFPDGPRRAVEVHDDLHQCLDEALAIAQSHLARQDPFIDFCGVPDEARYGFALTGAGGEHGHLALRSRGWWVLRWESPVNAVYSQWAAAPLANDAARAWAVAGMAAAETARPLALLVAASSSALSPQPL